MNTLQLALLAAGGFCVLLGFVVDVPLGGFLVGSVLAIVGFSWWVVGDIQRFEREARLDLTQQGFTVVGFPSDHRAKVKLGNCIFILDLHQVDGKYRAVKHLYGNDQPITLRQLIYEQGQACGIASGRPQV